MRKIITYKVLYRNYKLKKAELMGILVERRKDLRGISLVESGLKWAKSMFGHAVTDKHAILVVPQELSSKEESYGARREDRVQKES